MEDDNVSCPVDDTLDRRYREGGSDKCLVASILIKHISRHCLLVGVLPVDDSIGSFETFDESITRIN